MPWPITQPQKQGPVPVLAADGYDMDMAIARGIQVPFRADSVASPEVRYNVGSEETGAGTFLVVWISEPGCVARVTFEGFDSIRCCRGEHLPYKDDWVGDDYRHYPWVFEVEDSAWLEERHRYESQHYQTPLLEEYVHYLFSFHDEYVELIAKGIWFERMRYEQLTEPAANHPLADLPKHLPAEEFVVEGIQCSVRHNSLPTDELLDRSRLCSQSLFQYSMTLDGATKPSYAAKLRSIRGRPMTRLRGGLFYRDLLPVEGVGTEAEFRHAFEGYVREVAERRRKMGK